MENNGKTKERFLEEMEILINSYSGILKQACAAEIIHYAACWGAQSKIESIGILQAAVLDFHSECKRRAKIERKKGSRKPPGFDITDTCRN